MKTDLDQKYFALITECDALIKSGKISQVAAIISDLVIAQVPRSARQGLAKCCRRIGLIGPGLRLLHPLVRAQKILQDPANASEICEYSALLARNGSVHEALELLSSVDIVTAPEALLYRGQCHILNWDYAEAVECFEQFLVSSGEEYSKLIARVNLISGYIVLFRLDEAHATLNETLELAAKAGAARLMANCCELQGQVYFWQNDFANARRFLKQASDIFNNAQSFDQLLIHKTESLMLALEQKSTEPLNKFRALAAERKHWESVREADLFTLKVAPNQNQLDHLVFGTPRAAYRRRIEKMANANASETYTFGSKLGPQLTLPTGLVTDMSGLPLGKKTHQVISTLCKDFYAPINIGTLFFELYPNEYFDIDSSPFRLRQTILRMRQWLEENQLPAKIEQNNGAYRLVITGDFGIKLRLDQAAINATIARWQQLKERVQPGVIFKAEQICAEMGWSRSTFRRLADWACETQELRRSGTGKATTYTLGDARSLESDSEISAQLPQKKSA